MEINIIVQSPCRQPTGMEMIYTDIANPSICNDPLRCNDVIAWSLCRRAYLTMYLASSRGKIVYHVFLSCENKYTMLHYRLLIKRWGIQMSEWNAMKLCKSSQYLCGSWHSTPWPFTTVQWKPKVLLMTTLSSLVVLHVVIFTRGQFWPSGIVVACVCLCVRLCVR